MILLVHREKKTIVKVLKDDIEMDLGSSYICSKVFWELAELFPKELIGWCEEKYFTRLNIEAWNEIFHHDLIMASFALKKKFLPDEIGYVDQLPYINVNRNVQYATWQMSSDVGGIKGEVALKFRNLLNEISDFDYLLNCIGKLGQQNGLFCYSAPGLVTGTTFGKAISTASTRQLFEFVYRHYNTVWASVLLWCMIKYEKRFPVLDFLRSLGNFKFFQKNIDFSDVGINSKISVEFHSSLDVIIPTIGRSEYLFQVLKDLKEQTLTPHRVIIVEQNPDSTSKSNLFFLTDRKWPFIIKHHFTNQTGACNARNIALKEVRSEWVFFADDDIRMKPCLLEKAFNEINKYGICALNMNCKQEGEQTVFHKVKQWGSFGSGTSIVKSLLAKQCSFSLIYEYGYGEDADFGMQLRNKGCDIIYHPKVEILHLKAPSGGFRQTAAKESNKKEMLIPKPSPTIMVFALKYFSKQQMKGFKTSIFLKYYQKQTVKNPVLYLRQMNIRWKKSEKRAQTLINKFSKGNNSELH